MLKQFWQFMGHCLLRWRSWFRLKFLSTGNGKPADSGWETDRFNAYSHHHQLLEDCMSLLSGRSNDSQQVLRKQAFYKLLLQSKVFVPARLEAPWNPENPVPAGEYSLLSVKDFSCPMPVHTSLYEGGIETRHASRMSEPVVLSGHGFLAFTNHQLLSDWSSRQTGLPGPLCDTLPEVTALSLPFSQLCGQALYLNLDFILLNPGTEGALLISLYEIYHLAEGLIPPSQDGSVKEIVLEKETQIYLGIPLTPPSPMLMERLLGLFKQRESLVNKAYLFQIAIAQGPPHLAVGIHMVPEKAAAWENTLLPDTMAVIHEVLDDRDCVDLFLLNHDEGMESVICSFSEPFFQARLS